MNGMQSETVERNFPHLHHNGRGISSAVPRARKEDIFPAGWGGLSSFSHEDYFHGQGRSLKKNSFIKFNSKQSVLGKVFLLQAFLHAAAHSLENSFWTETAAFGAIDELLRQNMY
jgi:hypothetical protein